MVLTVKNSKNMKRIISIILIAAAAVLSFSSCHKIEWEGGADLTTLSLSYDKDGNTLPAISAAGRTIERAVVINQGSIHHNVEWTVSVDNEPNWVSVEKIVVESSFSGTYEGDDRVVTLNGVKITVKPNGTGAKRTAVIRFTVQDGSSISTLLTQTK